MPSGSVEPRAFSAPTGSVNRTSHKRWVICSLLFLATVIAYVDRGVIAYLKNTLESVIPGLNDSDAELRDLTACVPHILETLGCRILHLLPIGPTPTTYARFGRFGSPYAQQDLTGIDPALVEFDERTTGVEQFQELAHAVHLRAGLVFLDIVVNHTGWGSRLMEGRPQWFHRNPDGTFHSPGAWGVTWGDLVELDNHIPELWAVVSESLLTWCRRGVDGFRCDAGYMVPLPAWQYIVARVRQEFPDCTFLLEGLGGAWEATEALLTEGGMQWAYSELFQNYGPRDVSGYLDHAIRQAGGQVVRTQVGDRYVIERMLQDDLNVGGEQSGHMIFRDFTTTGDGIVSALQVLRIMMDTGKPLSELRKVCTKFPQVVVNVRVKEKPAWETLADVMKLVKDIEAKLNGQGRVLLRYSGTEPKARLLIEGPDAGQIKSFADEIAGMIRKQIGTP